MFFIYKAEQTIQALDVYYKLLRTKKVINRPKKSKITAVPIYLPFQNCPRK